jgi:GT2 family glycosyltransferase
MDPTAPAAVCFPVWRPDGAHLTAAVASALGQVQACEVVVSTDEHDEPAVRRMLADLRGSGRVQVLVAPPGLGMVAHWNRAVAASSAPIVVVPGQDDLLRPAMVARHLDVHADPEVVLVASGAALVVDTGARTGPARRRVHDRAAVLAGRAERRVHADEVTRMVLRNGNVVGAPSQVTFRRDAYDAVGGFSEAYEHAADADLWLRLATRGDVVLLGDELGTRRVHAGAATGEHRAGGAAARDRTRLAEDHGHRLDEAARAQAAAARTRWSGADAARAARRADLAGARTHLDDARRTLPLDARAWWAHLREAISGRNLDG